MFATLAGPLPPLAPPEASVDECLRAALEIQLDAGLGLLTDGGVDPVAPAAFAAGDPARVAREIVVRWQATAALASDRPVKAIVPGPVSLAASFASPVGGSVTQAAAASAAAASAAAAETLNHVIRELVAAGCPVVQVDEPDIRSLEDAAARALFRDAHTRVAAGIGGIHLSLALGPGAEAVRVAGDLGVLFDPPYASYLFDLIHGPDDWRVAVLVPGERGVICGAMDPAEPGPGDLELLLWAARYAASTQGRGMDRVGLAPARGLEAATADHARLKLRILGMAAGLATASREELREWIDPRAFDGP